jgi:hypothetical protein
MKTKLVCALFAGALLSLLLSTVQASPINTIQFEDGNALNIEGSYGSGADTAYIAIDFNNAGVTYAWQFNWDPSTPINGWQAMEDLAGQSVLITSPATTTTNVSNPGGDPNLTINATYYNSFAEHLITNMQYGSTAGINAWDFYLGTYNAASVSAGNPQGMSWTAPGVGVDDETLSNGEFLGWEDVLHHPPVPTLAETPEPRAAVLLVIMGAWMLTRRMGRRTTRYA